YTAATNRNIRVQYHTSQIVVDIVTLTIAVKVISEAVRTVKVKPVETTYFVRTVISTIFSTDTTVVCHLVQTFTAVVSSRYRTNVFTRCIVTVLAHHWLEYRLDAVRIVRITAEVAVNTDPAHFL